MNTTKPIPLVRDPARYPATTSIQNVLLPGQPRRLVDFCLTKHSGRTFIQAKLASKFHVMDFVFTGCSLRGRVVNDRRAEIQRLGAATPDVCLAPLVTTVAIGN